MKTIFAIALPIDPDHPDLHTADVLHCDGVYNPYFFETAAEAEAYRKAEGIAGKVVELPVETEPE